MTLPPRLAAAVRAVDAALESIHLALETLDFGVAGLEVLVEAVALGNELLLPLPEALLLHLDLLGEALAERLLLLLELGVVQLPRARLAKLPRLHLASTVRFVVVLLGRVDQVEHVGSDEDGAQLLEVAVLLVLDLGNAPRVLSALDGAAVVGLHILLRANDREGHGVDEAAGVLHGGSVVVLERRRVDLDALSINHLAHLQTVSISVHGRSCPTYPLLEPRKVRGAQCVGLGHDGNQVDACAELLHNLNVERLQRVARRADEVEAGVDTEVDLVSTARLLLLQHVRLVLVVEELDDGLPRVAVVDVVSESRRVDDGKADWSRQSGPKGISCHTVHTLEELLLELGLGDFNLDRLVHLLVVSSLVVGIVLDCRREERVDEGRLSEARLASHLGQSAGAVRGMGYRGHGTMMVKAAPRLATILCLSYVRLRRCVSAWASIPLVGELCGVLAGCSRAGVGAGAIRTLAMPIGDADSAMVQSGVERRCVWGCLRGVSGGGPMQACCSPVWGRRRMRTGVSRENLRRCRVTAARQRQRQRQHRSVRVVGGGGGERRRRAGGQFGSPFCELRVARGGRHGP